jgi:hypothetical protein
MMQVLWHCDIAAWMQFCLQHPLVSTATLKLRSVKLEAVDSHGNVEVDSDGNPCRAYGPVCTSKWQEEMEDKYFPGGLPDGVDIVGGMHAFDVTDLQTDGTRKAGNLYGSPAGFAKSIRCPDVPSPA